MASVAEFLTRTRGRANGGTRLHWTDWASYTLPHLRYPPDVRPRRLAGPLLLQDRADLQRYPPTFLPYQQQTMLIEGYDEPLPLFRMTGGDYEGMVLAQVRRVGLQAQMVDPANPGERLRTGIEEREPVQRVRLATENYTELFERFTFLRYFWNSTFITLMSTAIMLLVNSMAAFALSKYQFRGRTTVLLLVIGTLMIPQTVVLVPLFPDRDGAWDVQLALGRESSPGRPRPPASSCCASTC